MKIITPVLASILFLLTSFSSTPAIASGESIGSVSHIHSVRILNNQIILGTHTGLYKYIDPKTVERMSPEKFDVMGLSILGNHLYASGHPGPGSKLPEPVGLLLSTNLGKSWKQISLQGKVDFHLLESANSEIYGGDSQSGNILYSKNLGGSWTSRGTNTYSDLAISPFAKGSILGLRQGKMYSSSDSLITTKLIKSPYRLNFIEWNSERLIAASGEKLLISRNEGKTWKRLKTFSNGISALTQSRNIIGVVVGNKIYTSDDGAKTFTEV